MMHVWSCERAWSNLWSEKNVLYGTWVCERARSCFGFFVFFQNVSVDSQDTSSFLMNACCNLNTEQCESESLCSHSKKILTFLDNDRVNLGSTLQTRTAKYSDSFQVSKVWDVFNLNHYVLKVRNTLYFRYRLQDDTCVNQKSNINICFLFPGVEK